MNVDGYFRSGTATKVSAVYQFTNSFEGQNVPSLGTFLVLNKQSGVKYHIQRLLMRIGGTIGHSSDKQIKIIADGSVINDRSWTNAETFASTEIRDFYCSELVVQASCSLALNQWSDVTAEIVKYVV